MDEKNKEITTENTQESTIFSKPEIQDKKAKKAKKKLSPLKIIIILISLVLILCGAIFGFWFATKDSDDTSSGTTVNTILVFDNETINIKKVNIKNKNGNLEFNAAKVDTEDGKMDSFLLKGYDASLIADSYITSIVDKIASLEALRKMDGDGDYGFDKPNAIISVTGKNGLKDYSFKIGDISPDGTGYYLKVDKSDKIYLIAVSVAELFLSSVEDLSNNMLVVPPQEGEVSDEYFSDEGVLDYVDYIKVSGKSYKLPIVIKHINNDLATYRMTSPYNRYADKEVVTGYTELITSGVVANGCYKINPKKSDFKKYGLDNPDAVIEILYDDQKLKITAKKQDSENFAVIINDLDAIYQLTSETLKMLDYKALDLVNDYCFLEAFEDFENITFNDNGKKYSFDIKYNEDDNTTEETLNGKKIDDDLFRAYFEYYLYIKPEILSSYNKNQKAIFTATFNFANSKKDAIKIEFIKHNARQYIVKIDGNIEGVISYTYFENIKTYLQNVINKKGIPSVL